MMLPSHLSCNSIRLIGNRLMALGTASILATLVLLMLLHYAFDLVASCCARAKVNLEDGKKPLLPSS